MNWSDKLKQAGVNIHVIATGGGAGLQQELWSIPGSSAYFSGASFPYDQDEQEDLLGFRPEHFCSEDAAIDLASAAYMKAFKFANKQAVGIGITASVASDKAHRGEHRIFACMMTDTKVVVASLVLTKGVGIAKRYSDGETADFLGMSLLTGEFYNTHNDEWYPFPKNAVVRDVTERARERFFKHPFFMANGKRQESLPQGAEQFYALMPGSFNPPHEGHFGSAESFRNQFGKSVVFEIGTNHPNKTSPTVQELLQRAKMLKGYDVIFTKDIPFYLDKASYWHGMSFIVGADTMQRILDPKWGNWIQTMDQCRAYGSEFYISGREVDGKFITRDDIVESLPEEYMAEYGDIMHDLKGRWDISSTELRKK